jgi:Adenylate kinase
VRIVLMGPPGSGKGTQAQLLSQTLRVPHISTGELFRQHISEQSELGLLAKTYLDTGELVPSAVTSEMVRDRLTDETAQPGFLTLQRLRPSPTSASNAWCAGPKANPIITPHWASSSANCCRSSIRAWRLRGDGPPAVRVGTALRWDPREVDEWLDSRRESRWQAG